MVVFPNAKINLGLNIINKRPDGYHNIASCFYPVPWCDILEFVPGEMLSFQSTGIPIPGQEAENLCLKAYHLIKRDFDIPPLSIHLHKIIPIGGGLGGGSADGSFMLKALNEYFELNIPVKVLKDYAGRIGSDCPFFMENKPLLAEGTGDLLSPLSIDLTGWHLVIVVPDIHVSTAVAYKNVTPAQPKYALPDIIESKPPEAWNSLLSNDFEVSVFSQFPEIAKLKNEFYRQGAVYASMSGSGASVYGLFEKTPQNLAKFKGTIWQGML